MNRNRQSRITGKKKGRTRSLSWARVLLVCCLLFIAMMVYVWKQIKINQLAREVNALKRKKEQLVNDTKTLQMEIAGLSRLSRIGEIAMKKVNLQYPDQYPVVFKLNPAVEKSKTMVTAAAFGRVRAGLDHVKTLLLPAAEAGAPAWE